MAGFRSGKAVCAYAAGRNFLLETYHGALSQKILDVFCLPTGVQSPNIGETGHAFGMRTIDLFVIGCVAAIGCTVSLFIAAVAFDSSVMLGDVPVQDAAKMGALFSFVAAIISLIAGKLTGVVKQEN